VFIPMETLLIMVGQAGSAVIRESIRQLVLLV